MTIEITVNWCEDCSTVEMDQSITICKVCTVPLTPIGFVKKERPDIGGALKRGTCGCGKPAMLKGHDSRGRKRYRSDCSSCRHATRKYPVTHCELCGVKSTGKGTIERDHIDGNRSNNNPENLQSLCTDCHKKKTSKDIDNRVYKKLRESIDGKNG
jgi:5-methylcytosine-specific restriction endonuclease McrA